MLLRTPAALAAALCALVPACASAPQSGLVGISPPPSAAPGAPPQRPAWIARSDENARTLVAVDVQFEPEGASRVGIEEADERTVDLGPDFRARHVAALRDAIHRLDERKAGESDPLVLGDIAIMQHEADLAVRDIEARDRTMVACWDVARIVFSGVHVLLDDRIPAARRAHAVDRLKRYVGQAPGATPLAELAKADVTARMTRPSLMPCARLDVEKSLSTTAALRDGTAKLFAKYGVKGADDALKALGQQLEAYDAFVKTTVLPKAREGFALPPDVYTLRLERVGVDIPPADLARMAHDEFTSIQGEMAKVAAVIAQQRHLPSPDYRDVIRELKKEQLTGDAILPHFEQRLAQIEEIIRHQNLVTLPARPARIRLGTAAESAQQPAPHMDPPRLVGNTGEQGEFVLPLGITAATGIKEAESKYDDFTYAAASWTLTSHEVRPGHELQFDSMVERGTSLARAHYAFNSVNVEGWGLYSEAIMLPFMPPEGQLVSLQFRLQRAARAFLDPELQQGKWTFDSAREFLEKEVVLSHAFATAEVERYTFRMPGQATSYFYGFTKLRALRAEVEQKAGPKFDARAFHDAILDQGLLPPDQMRAAVLKKLSLQG
jgi:uncharacterized protein (DUF885 family)